MADRFRCDLIPREEPVLCALSGGADSMYLLCRLLECGYTVCAAHYNHCLRVTAERDEAFVRDWCQSRGIPLIVGRGSVEEYASARGLGIEEAARELRYEFLKKTAAEQGCLWIATGHHAGDNAETVLMNLIRGCGLSGLSGIPVRRDNIVRPMLEVTREEIDRFLETRQIPHVEDESNTDPAYTRNRIRHRILPLLEELNPQAVDHITAAARRAGEDDAELNRQAELFLHRCVQTEEGISVPLSVLTDAPRPVALRVLKRLAPAARSVHLEQMLSLGEADRPSASLDIPNCTVRRVYNALLLSGQEEPCPESAPLKEGEQQWGSWSIVCTPAVCPPKAYVSREEFYLLTDEYLIRSRREGDELRLGRRPLKTLKKLMIEEQVPRHLRPLIPVLEGSGGSAAAAGGFGPHREALARPGTACLKILIRKGE